MRLGALVLDDTIAQRLKVMQAEVDARVVAGEKANVWQLGGLVRQHITEKLLSSQNQCCAYCEARIHPDNMHIEHVVERHDDVSRMYDPHNMIISCEGGRFKAYQQETQVEKEMRAASISCGHYKTVNFHQANKEIDYDLFISPLKEDIYESVQFNNGVMEPKHGLPTKQATRVAYTIDRLNLNALRLVYARRFIFESALLVRSKYKTAALQKRFMTNLMKDKAVQVPFLSFLKYNLVL